jgi:antitoxin component YwqK of YwqJK toxin-antitoxin module
MVQSNKDSFRLFFLKILVNLGEFTVFMLGLSIVLYLFQLLIGQVLLGFLIQYAKIEDDAAAKFIIYIYTASSSILVLLFYWMMWESNFTQAVVHKHISKVIVKNYYKDIKRLNVDEALGSFSKFQKKELDVDEDKKDAVIDGIVVSGNGIFFTPEQLIPEYKRTDGLHQLRYDNGHLKLEATYKNKKLEGPCRTYYEDGRLHQDRVYLSGKLNGVYRSFDENGILYFEISYKDDRQHGLDKIYNKNGFLQFCDNYVDGYRVNRKTYDDRGKFLFSQDFDPPQKISHGMLFDHLKR